ncbi:hypothetical protein DEO72_LG5g2235 [Vigna unguiculata]|uniref:Uncharacterized protein n=1 Tax=Vigna unguiculata TaxID=3917 RepID=A0A4D6LZF5_VIGUN|nr:hypothetical protein DEO72_LG5g2235 [Vigna unguiculata]
MESCGASTASLGEIELSTIWQASPTTRHQAPSSAHVSPIPLGGTIPSIRRHTSPVASATILGPYLLVACPTSPGVIPVAQFY